MGQYDALIPGNTATTPISTGRYDNLIPKQPPVGGMVFPVETSAQSAAFSSAAQPIQDNTPQTKVMTAAQNIPVDFAKNLWAAWNQAPTNLANDISSAANDLQNKNDYGASGLLKATGRTAADAAIAIFAPISAAIGSVIKNTGGQALTDQAGQVVADKTGITDIPAFQKFAMTHPNAGEDFNRLMMLIMGGAEKGTIDPARLGQEASGLALKLTGKSPDAMLQGGKSVVESTGGQAGQLPKDIIPTGASAETPIPFANKYETPSTIQMGVKPKDTLPVAASSPVEAPVSPESAPTAPITPKVENPLAQEAQKYKSAEEFVKGVDAKSPTLRDFLRTTNPDTLGTIDTLYHGTSEQIKGNLGTKGGLWLTEDKTAAQKYIGSGIYGVKGSVEIVKIPPNVKIYDAYVKGDFKNNFSLKQLEDYYGKKGYDGVRINDFVRYEKSPTSGYDGQYHPATAIFPSGLKKINDFKSQLTDFYNKVTKPAEVKATPKAQESRVAPLNEPAPKTVTPQKTGEITKAASDINATLVKQGYDALTPELQSKYTPESYKAELVKAKDLAGTNYEDAVARATGKKPVGNYEGQILFNEVKRIATENGDGQALIDLAASPIGKARSLAAQTLGASGYMSKTDGVDAVESIQQANDFKAKALEKKGIDIAKETTKDTQTFKSEVKSARSSRQSWSDFAKQIICNI